MDFGGDKMWIRNMALKATSCVTLIGYKASLSLDIFIEKGGNNDIFIGWE